jgi:hypothetical protein
MDDPVVNIISREATLAKFDHARNDFMDAYLEVPDESLVFMPEGDDYTIGYVLIHLNTSITQYTGLLEQMREAVWAPVAPTFPERPPLDTLVDRATALAELEQAHDKLARRLNELTTDEFERKCDVTFPDTTEPWPTSARDITGWLTDHYYEHIPHVQALVESWRKTGKM